MSTSISTSSSALLLALSLALAPREAAAQACCGGPTAFAPARLAPHEDALVGLQTKVSGALGTFDAQRRFTASPGGTAEVEVEEDVVAAARVLRRAQVSMLLPVMLNVRRVPGLSEVGGDLGDLQLAARWDFLFAGERAQIPGIAASIGLTLPTGRAAEAAQRPLATDATGAGRFEISPALSLEHAFGPVLVNLTGSMGWRSARTVGAVSAQQGLSFTASTSSAWVWRSGAVLGLSASHTSELAAKVDGMTVPDSGRAATRLGVAGGLPFAGGFRLQGAVFGDLPLRWLGRNQPAMMGASVMVVKGFS